MPDTPKQGLAAPAPAGTTSPRICGMDLATKPSVMFLHVQLERRPGETDEQFRDRVNRALAELDPTRPAPTQLDNPESNAAAMRAALEYAREVLALNGFVEPVVRCDAALAAPPRNCDVGTAEEQAKRFRSFCDIYNRCGSCPLDFTDDIVACPIEWAQMPFAPAK